MKQQTFRFSPKLTFCLEAEPLKPGHRPTILPAHPAALAFSLKE
jgi:hypothetical protein